MELTASQYVEKEGVSLSVLCSLYHVGGEAHKMSTLAIMGWEIVSLHRPAKKDWRPWRGDFCYLLSLWSFGHFHFHRVLAAATAFRFGLRSLEGGRWGHQYKVEICFRCCKKSWDIPNKYYELVDKYLTNVSKIFVNPNSVDYKPQLWQHQNFLGEKWEIQAALRIPTPTPTP